MKKKLLKLVAIATVFALSTSISGCKKQTSEAVGKNGEYPGSPVTVNGDEIYPLSCEDTLTYWKGINSDLGTKYANFADTPIAKKIAEETGVKIEYIHPAVGAGSEQIQIMLTTDDLPDIVSHSWNVYPGGPQAAIDEQYIYGLNDLIEKYAPALKKLLSENREWDRQLKTDEGNYYAFPQIVERGLLQVTQGPVIRADFLEKLGLEVPETIDEWENVLRGFKNELGVIYPYVGSTSQLIATFGPAFGINPDWYRDGEEIKYGYAQPGYKELMKKLNEWYKEGLITPDFISIDTTNAQKFILNDQAGSTIAWAASGMGKMLSAGQGDFSLCGAPYPSPKKGENAEYGYLTSEMFMGRSVAISKNCKNPELATRLLDYGFTEEGHMLYNFGEESVAYNMVDDYPKYSNLLMNNPDGYTISEAFASYTGNGNEPMRQDTRYIEQYYTQPELKEAQRQWVKTNMNDHMLPQLYVLQEESDKDGDTMAAVKTYVDEMTIKFITGDEPIDKFDKYVEQLEKFGLSQSVQFRQNAYGRYLKR